MLKRRLICMVLGLAMVASTLVGVTAVSAEGNEHGDEVIETAAGIMSYNFKSDEVSGVTNVKATDVYSAEKGYGFVGKSGALRSSTAAPVREVDTSRLSQDATGVNITETSSTTTVSTAGANNYNNYGGLIFRVDTGAPGVYKVVVKTTTDSGTAAINGMQASKITSGGVWDAAGLVPKTAPAAWSGNTWTYQYASGFDFLEIEIEPKTKDGGTVGLESVVIEPIANNAAGSKPTLYILGDSTQKTYTFEEDSMSSWGQTLYSMFDADKVNAVNYSMGGRAMKSNYEEGRFNDMLLNVREGDYVLIHSAHNDETNYSTEKSADARDRFIRGADKTQYQAWLDMYCSAIESRGATPVLVSGVPRTNNGTVQTSTTKPNGFDPDSPGFMKAKAVSDAKAEFVDLFNLAKTEFEKIGTEETIAIYQSLEAGESPGKTNSGSYANGHPDNKVDGTHYKEAAGKLFSQIIAKNIYDQSIASGASAKITELAGYLKTSVQSASVSGDWSEVFPERAKDVTNAKVNGYNASNSYYRNQIEKMLQLGIMSKNSNGEFEPNKNIKTNDFIAALCAIWNLDTAKFSKFYNSGDLTREVMAAIILDAYEMRFGKDADGNWNKPVYMTDYNGTNLSPDDPNYDPNLTGASAQYYPLVGWGNLTDTDQISREYLVDFQEVYNLGLMRSEKGISRGKMTNGTELEPKGAVTREKAAKELYFLFGLVQNKKTENQEITIPSSYGGTEKNSVVYNAIEYTAPMYEFSSVDISSAGKLSVSLSYNGSDTPANKLVVEIKNADGSTKETKQYDVTGSGEVQGMDITLAVGESINMYVAASDSEATKLSADRSATMTNISVPPKEYTATTVAGIENGTVELTNLGAISTESEDEILSLSAEGTTWKASKSVSAGETLMEGLTPVSDMVYSKGASTIDGVNYAGYIKTDPKQNGDFSDGVLKGSALKFVAPSDGVFWISTYNLGANKRFVIIEEGASSKEDNVAYSYGTQGNIGISAPVEKGKTYYTAVLGSGSQFIAASFTPGAPVVSVKAYQGDTVQVDTIPAEGYSPHAMPTVTDKNGNNIDVQIVNYGRYTFVMPESDVTVDVKFFEESIEPILPVSYDYEITKAEFDASGNLSVDLSYNGTEANPTAKLLIGVYDKNDSKIMTNSAVFDVEGTTVKDLFFVKPDNGETVKLYIWDGTDGIKPLSEVKTASNNAANLATPPPSPSPTNEPTSPPVKKVTVVQASSQETFEYDTIREAVAKAKELNPQSEADRVTINVDPADYEEQVVFDNVKYITLQQTPNTNGVVDLHWYYCTGYSAANCDLSGSYNPDIDWYTNPPQDTSGKTYKIGELISAGTTLTYTDLKGESHTYTIGSRDQCLGNTGGLDKMATLIIRNNAENITVKDLNIVNSVPVFATQGEKDAHLTPNEDYPDLPDRSMLANCTEYTAEEKIDSMGEVTKAKYEAYAASNTLTAGQSAWLARSGAFNERGHAVSFYSGDKIIFENIRLRGNQDSLYAAGGRAYFKNCDIIGGTDYIYGGATAVFDNCKLGLEGFSDKTYGSPIATGGHDVMRKYGYLFYNCTLYNMRDNNGTNNFGGPWQAGSQVTYFNCIIDDNASVGKSKFVLDEMGWRRFGAENGLSRSYEYGTKNISGTAVDFSKRVVNKSVEEGGPGMGTVLNEWQILEFNPRNYFSKECDSKYTDDWDPMNFADTYLSKVDAAIAAATVTIPSNEETTFALQQAPEGVTFKWESASTNAVVSEDGKNITVIRPAAGEENIETKVILYAMDNENKFGDKKEIPVIITPTTNTTDVFSIPVTITESTSLSEDTEYYITISKNGAVIKKQTVTIPAGSTTAAATIENIPSNTTGIEYDVKIVSQSDEMAIVTPADGITKVNGITGQSVALNITAQKAIDEKIDVDITTSAADGNKTYDLIALAKANGANDSVATSDIISVEFDLDLTMAPGSASYIDISSGTPSNANGATPQRFTAIKINNSWTQLDSVDNSQGWSGSSNGPGQCLNITGKFDYKTTHHVKATIDYKAGTVTIDGSDSGSGKTATPYTFEHFPENVEKGKLNMGVFVGSNSDKYTISNVTVTYKKVRTSSDPNSYTVSVAEPDNNADVKIMNGENPVETMTADINSTVTVRVDVNTDEGVSISTNPVAAVTLDETKSNAQYNYYTFAMPSNNTTIKVKRTEYVEPEPPYGKVVDNDDGSKTLYFGTESITQSNSQAKIVSATVNNVELKRPDYFYPGSNGYGELTMSEINLKDSGYDKVEFVLANRDTSDVVIKVGGTQVASFTGVTTGDWSTYQTFAADLSTTDAEGNVTIESTITSGDFCGNFAWVRFYKSN